MALINILKSIINRKQRTNHKGGGLVVKAWSPKGENTWRSQVQILGAAKIPSCGHGGSPAMTLGY